MKSPDRQSVPDRLGAEAEPKELCMRDDVMLAACDPPGGP
jgi:hypothetical protein